MIVVDASIFIDQIFEYNAERTQVADSFFMFLEEQKISIIEPDLFEIELTGQVSRRMKRDDAPPVLEDIFRELSFIDASELFDIAISVALQTGCRAADSLYISAARLKGAVLASNDRFQVDSARRYGIEAYSLLQDRDALKVRLLRKST
jgi:uncharacterized protein